MRSIRLSFAIALLAAGACHRATLGHGPSLPSGVNSAMLAQGDSLFHAGVCTRCHGPNGEGATNGPSLTDGPWLHSSGTVSDLTSVILAGIPRDEIREQSHRFQMNPRGGPMNLTTPQAKALAAYVWSISRRKTKEEKKDGG